MQNHPEILNNKREEILSLYNREEYAIYKYRFVEIEARDVANRLNLTAEERKQIEPLTSELINTLHIECKLNERPNKDITKSPPFKT
jgi:hypothetical protein